MPCLFSCSGAAGGKPARAPEGGAFGSPESKPAAKAVSPVGVPFPSIQDTHWLAIRLIGKRKRERRGTDAFGRVTESPIGMRKTRSIPITHSAP